MTTLPSAPPTRRGQRTRDHIVSTAAELMLTNGANRTTIDDVIDAAGVGKSQIYHYFTGKADLIQAVIARQTRNVLDPQGPHLAPLDSWGEWERWRESVIAYQEQHECIGGCPLGSLAGELADTDESARLALCQSFDEWERAFAAGLHAMKAAGRLAGDTDTDTLACSVLAALQGGLLLCQLRKSTVPLRAALDGALTQIGAHRAG